MPKHPEPFLPEHLVMVDCEMVGVRPDRDALLQVAMLKLQRCGNEYKVLKDPLNAFLAYPGQPHNDFHKQFLTHVFKKCNQSKLTPAELREQVHAWLGPLKGTATPVGDCVSTDIDFLLHNKVIDRSDIVNGKPVPGTFHYESFDLNPVKLITRHRLGHKAKPEGAYPREHDALADCVNQTLELNFFLKHLLG
jgi:oligoribonuclease (3'-5' exoribonuclease)